MATPLSQNKIDEIKEHAKQLGIEGIENMKAKDRDLIRKVFPLMNLKQKETIKKLDTEQKINELRRMLGRMKPPMTPASNPAASNTSASNTPAASNTSINSTPPARNTSGNSTPAASNRASASNTPAAKKSSSTNNTRSGNSTSSTKKTSAARNPSGNTSSTNNTRSANNIRVRYQEFIEYISKEFDIFSEKKKKLDTLSNTLKQIPVNPAQYQGNLQQFTSNIIKLKRELLIMFFFFQNVLNDSIQVIERERTKDPKTYRPLALTLFEKIKKKLCKTSENGIPYFDLNKKFGANGIEEEPFDIELIEKSEDMSYFFPLFSKIIDIINTFIILIYVIRRISNLFVIYYPPSHIEKEFQLLVSGKEGEKGAVYSQTTFRSITTDPRTFLPTIDNMHILLEIIPLAFNFFKSYYDLSMSGKFGTGSRDKQSINGKKVINTIFYLDPTIDPKELQTKEIRNNQRANSQMANSQWGNNQITFKNLTLNTKKGNGANNVRNTKTEEALLKVLKESLSLPNNKTKKAAA